MTLAQDVNKKVSLVDKLLPLLIILAIIIGIVISVYAPNAQASFGGVTVVGVSVPLAVGMIIMMIPPFFKVRWEFLNQTVFTRSFARSMMISLVINWIVCPLFMLGLAWLTLFDQPEFRTGIIMIGTARCIAMVVLWNDIAGGSTDLCAIIVVVNSLLQLVLYAPYQLLLCYVISGDPIPSMISYSLVAKTLVFFLGIPIVAGIVLRFVAKISIGVETGTKFLSPFAPLGLLYTVIVIFIEKGKDFLHETGPAFRCFAPLFVYFVVVWNATFFGLRWLFGRTVLAQEENDPLLCGCEKEKESNPKAWKTWCSAPYQEVATHAFTAASNNFELSLSVAISLYGANSKQAIAATFGPVLEIPLLMILCFVSLYFRRIFLWLDVRSAEPESPTCDSS